MKIKNFDLEEVDLFDTFAVLHTTLHLAKNLLVVMSLQITRPSTTYNNQITTVAAIIIFIFATTQLQ